MLWLVLTISELVAFVSVRQVSYWPWELYVCSMLSYWLSYYLYNIWGESSSAVLYACRVALVAQLVECSPECHGFESHPVQLFLAALLFSFSCPGCSWLVCFALPFYLDTSLLAHAVVFIHLAQSLSFPGSLLEEKELLMREFGHLFSPEGQHQIRVIIVAVFWGQWQREFLPLKASHERTPVFIDKNEWLGIPY